MSPFMEENDEMILLQKNVAMQAEKKEGMLICHLLPVGYLSFAKPRSFKFQKLLCAKLVMCHFSDLDKAEVLPGHS